MSDNSFIDPLASGLVFLPVKFSRNQIEHVIDAVDTSLPDRSSLRYYLELLTPEFTGSSNFQRLVKMPGTEKPPQTSNGSSIYEGAFFQLAELLDGFLEPQKPDFGETGLSIVSTLTMPYMARESATVGGQPVASAAKQLASQWLLKAGLTERDFAAWGSSFFTDYMSENRPFLTWQPDNKLLAENQPEYLYFLLNISPTPSRIIRRVRVFYTNGTSQVLDAGALTGGQQFQVVCAPVHLAALAINPATVIRYEVWLSDENYNRISQVRSYTVDHSYQSQERFILFANSLGGWDTLRLTGESSETLTTTRTTATLERPAGAPADFSELRVVHLEGSRELQVNTGWLERQTSAQLRYLDELLLAKLIYLVDSRGQQALELQTSTLVDYEDNQDLVARTFTFRYATPQKNYSSLPAAPATPARPTKWRGVGVVVELDGYGKRTGYGRPLKLQKYYVDNGQAFKPLTEKPNQPGNPDYVGSLPLAALAAGSTPYPNQALTRTTTFRRSTCTNGQMGDVATVSIPAGKYGSEVSQAEADSRAEAEYNSLNTQAFANAYGSCTAAPELYQVAVADGQWRYRVSDGNKFEIEYFLPLTDELKLGNTWDLQGQNRPFVYSRFSNDLAFPVKPNSYRMYVYGNPNSAVDLLIYNNGALKATLNLTINRDGYEYIGLSDSVAIGSGDKLYLKSIQR